MPDRRQRAERFPLAEHEPGEPGAGGSDRQLEFIVGQDDSSRILSRLRNQHHGTEPQGDESFRHLQPPQ
jgi:hypothetical protein